MRKLALAVLTERNEPETSPVHSLAQAIVERVAGADAERGRRRRYDCRLKLFPKIVRFSDRSTSGRRLPSLQRKARLNTRWSQDHRFVVRLRRSSDAAFASQSTMARCSSSCSR